MLRKKLLGMVVVVSSLLVSVSQASAYTCEQPKTLTPTGYVSYSVNGGVVTTANVVGGVFKFNDKNGTIDDGGYVTHPDINNGTKICIFTIPGVTVTGWQIGTQPAVTATQTNSSGAAKPVVTATAINEADGAGQNLTVEFNFTASNVSKLTYNCGTGGSGDISSFKTNYPGRGESKWLKKPDSGFGPYYSYDGSSGWNGIFYAKPQMTDLAATMSLGTYTCSLTGTSPDGSTATSNSFSFTVVKTNADYKIGQFTNGIGVVLPNGVSGVTTIGTTGANTTFQSRDFKVPADAEILGAINSIADQQSARNYVLSNHLTISKIKDIATRAGSQSKYTGTQIESFIGGFSKPTISISRSDNFGGSSGRKLWGMTVTANDAIRLDWDCSYIYTGDVAAEKGKKYNAFPSNGAGYTTNSLILPPAEPSNNDASFMIPQASIYLPGNYTCNYVATGPDGQITNQIDTFTVPRGSNNQGSVSTYQTNVQTVTNTSTTGVVTTQTGGQITGNAAIDPSSESCLSIPMTLSYQSRDVSTNGFVTKLQDFLHTTNYLTTASTGFFGAGTLKAVKAFQGANGISKTGSAGPNTRAKILQISCAMPVQDIAESDATIPDTGSTTSLPTGCTSTNGFSPITGIKCSVTALPEGCTSNTTFSPVTGVRCVAQ